MNGQTLIMSPVLPQGGRDEAARIPEIRVPPRVGAAMELLNFLAAKTMQRPAGNGVAFEIIDGQKLTDEEVSAQATAANVVERYLSGNLPADDWEKPVQTLILGYCSGQFHKHVKRGRGRRGRATKGDVGPCAMIGCPVCGPNQGNTLCAICKGDGRVVAVRQRDFVRMKTAE